MAIDKRTVEDYLNCKYKMHLRLAGETGTPHEYEVLAIEKRGEYRSEATETLLHRFKLESPPTIPSVTLDDLSKGHSLILNCAVEYEQFSFSFDALRRVDGKSRAGRFHYVPVLYSQRDIVRSNQRLLLAIAAFVLEKVQGVEPSIGYFVIGSTFSITYVRLSSLQAKVKTAIEELVQIATKQQQPKLILNRHCELCEFRQHCRNEALEKDDLSLLRGISTREIANSQKKGIFTLHQLSHTFRPRRRPKHLRDRPLPYQPSLHALAIREKKTYVLNRPSIPSAKTSVYLDMEGDFEGRFVYLIGALSVRGEEEAFCNFWADTRDDERTIFKQFYCWLKTQGDVRIFHYGSYETKAFKRLKSLAPSQTLARLSR